MIKNREEIIVCAVFMFFALGFNIYRVNGDGELYYSFLEHILHIPNPEIPRTPGFQQAGVAYFNAPFYFFAYVIESLFRKNWNFNGITLRQIAINFASNFYMLLSLILAIKILKKLHFKKTILPVLSILFSTSAFAVAVVMPSYSHTVDIFINTLFIYLFLVGGEKYTYTPLWLGILCTVAILVRYSNVALILPVIIYYLWAKEYKKIKYFLLGFLGTSWIIPLLFYVYNGSALRAILTEGLYKQINFVPKNFLKYLVHPLHGLFIWSPVTIFSAYGLTVLPKVKERLGLLLLGIWISLLLLCGFYYDWYAGWSFSNRYIVSLFAVYVIGLAAFIERYSNRAVFITIWVATFYSIFLFFNWYLSFIRGDFGTPINMFQYWIKGESPNFSEKVNLSTFLRRIYETCRYKYLFMIFR